MESTDRDPSIGRVVLALASATLLGAGGLGVGVIVLVLATVVAIVAFGELSLAAALGLSLVSVQGVGCVVVSIAYLRSRPTIAAGMERTFGWSTRRRLQIGVSWPSGRDLLVTVGGWIGAFLGVFAVAIVVQYVLLEIVGQEPGANPVAEAGLEQPELLLLLIPAMILLVGPAEELLFRGIVQGRLREVFRPVSAIAISSVLFAGLHYFVLTGGTPTANAVAVSLLLIPSVVMGATYEYTDNLVVPSLIHGLYNSTLLALLYVGLAYGDELEDAGAMLALAGIA